MNHQIEKLIWQFRATEPDLYDKYQTARSIAGAPNSVVAAENPLPIVTNKAA